MDMFDEKNYLGIGKYMLTVMECMEVPSNFRSYTINFYYGLVESINVSDLEGSRFEKLFVDDALSLFGGIRNGVQRIKGEHIKDFLTDDNRNRIIRAFGI